MTILVTGAAGFVGSHLIHALHAQGEKVIGIDNFNDYYSPDLKRMRVAALVSDSIEIISGDLSDSKMTENIVGDIRPSIIYHLAAQAGVRLNLEENYQYVQSNLVGFSNVLEASIKFGIRNFLYASSSSVYGNSANFPYSESDKEISPISFYGATKLSNEILASALVRGTSTKARGLRFFTVYGPWGRPDMAYLRLAESLINRHEFKLYGNGEAVRDFTYIDDTISATIALGEQLEQVRDMSFADVVNIGGGKPKSMLDLIHAFEEISQQTINVKRFDRIVKDVDQTIADFKRLEILTKFKPKIDLNDGVARVMDWANSANISPKLEFWTKSVN